MSFGQKATIKIQKFPKAFDTQCHPTNIALSTNLKRRKKTFPVSSISSTYKISKKKKSKLTQLDRFHNFFAQLIFIALSKK